MPELQAIWPWIGLLGVLFALVWIGRQKKRAGLRSTPESPPWIARLAHVACGQQPYSITISALLALEYNVERLLHHASLEGPWQTKIPVWLTPIFSHRWGKTFSEPHGAGVILAIFLLACLWLSAARLRDARLNPWWALLLLVPFVNVLMLVLLCCLPSGGKAVEQTSTPQGAPNDTRQIVQWIGRLIPSDLWGSAALAVALCALLGLAAVGFSTDLGNYGFGLFMGIPFCVGLFAVLIYGYHQRRPFLECILVAGAATLLLGVLLAALAIEGVICLIMATPLVLVYSLVGGSIGFAIQNRIPRASRETLSILLALTLSWPLLTGAESRLSVEATVYPVVSEMVINAPPETVWRHVVTFSKLPPPTEWVFQTGIAYPLRAEIQGQGVGAVRHCIFSTGEFVEPIEVWDAPHRLGFGVRNMPMPMHEWSYQEIHPPHMDHYLNVAHGEFRLLPMPGGRTRLIGTTWYSNRIWPATYWKLWSDGIIHAVHLRVLRHIKQLSEA